MKHSELQRMVSAYADGELGRPEHSLVEQHLKVCKECSIFLAGIQAVRAHIREEARIRVHPNFSACVMERLHENEKNQIRWSDIEPTARRTVVFLSALAAIWIALFTIKDFTPGTMTADSMLGSSGDQTASVLLIAEDE
jgi:anti-sigma factor RsiW